MANEDDITRARERRTNRHRGMMPNARDPLRFAPMEWGRDNPWGDAYQGRFGHDPQYGGFSEYGWGGGGADYEVLFPAGALVTNHRGKGPRGYTRSDERIEEEINDRLTWHPDIDASDVDVRVQHGEVTLAGTVDSRFMKRLVRDVADSVDGVKDVHNTLEILPRF